MRFSTPARLIGALALLFALPSIASAQAGSSGFGVKGGFNISSVKVDFDDVSVTGDGRAGILLGAFYAVDFNPHFGIQVEGLFTQKGTEFGVEDDLGFDDDTSFKLNYIEFPVLARVNFPASAATVRLLAGPAIGFKASQSIKVGNIEIDADEVPLKSFDFGLALGGAVEINRFIVDARYTWGLTDINDSDDAEEPTVKNRAFSFSVGWRF